jgi:hypothetical protein
MKKKKTGKLTPEFWERDAEARRHLAERIALLEQKLKEEQAKRDKR